MKQKISFKKWVKLLAMCCMLCLLGTMQVKADEHPLVEVQIEMTDSTSKATCEDIVITLTNMETGETEVLTLTWTETYGIGELYRTLLPADIEYSVSCSVKGYDNIELLDIKGAKCRLYQYHCAAHSINGRLLMYREI